jgi:DNA primase
VFGEEHWPTHGHRDIVFVTEGAIDALAIERALRRLGWPLRDIAIAGIYGSQLHEGHLSRLSTFKRHVWCTDPDKAGESVAKSLMDKFSRWSSQQRLEIPEGNDPGALGETTLGETVLDDILAHAILQFGENSKKVD